MTTMTEIEELNGKLMRMAFRSTDPEVYIPLFNAMGHLCALSCQTAMLETDIKQLAQDLIDIAQLAMPDTYFATDSRVKRANELLSRH